MQLTNFYHRHHLHRLAGGHSNFRIFELAIWLHSLAQSLVWVFIPIILLQIGYSVRDILIYFLIFNVIDVPLNFVVAALMRKIGARKVLIIGTVAVIGFFGVLNILPLNNWPLLIILATLEAIYDTFFWISHIYIFTEINREKGLDVGNTTGALEAVRKLANIAGPIVGAGLLIWFGKSSLLISSILINALSIFVLFKMRHLHDMPTESHSSLRHYFADSRERRGILSEALWGIHSEVDSVLWPLFIFIIFGSIGSVAAVPVIVALTTAVLSYVAGKLTKKYTFKMIAIGSLLIAATWMLRLVFQNSMLYYVTIFLVGFLSLLVSIPIDSIFVHSGLRKGSLAASTFRNTSGMFSRAVLYAVLLLMLEVFKVSFGLAAFSLLVIFFVTLILNSRQKRTPV